MIEPLERTDGVLHDRRERAMQIVHRYVLISAAAGAVSVPLLDVAALGAVHVALIKALTEHYGASFSEHAARNILIAIGVSLIPGSFGSVVASRVLRALPLVTHGIGLAAMSAASAAVSFSLGVVFVRHFELGGTLDTFDVANLHRVLAWRTA
jgi:uncharacterized protein (DUF697 family)